MLLVLDRNLIAFTSLGTSRVTGAKQNIKTLLSYLKFPGRQLIFLLGTMCLMIQPVAEEVP